MGGDRRLRIVAAVALVAVLVVGLLAYRIGAGRGRDETGARGRRSASPAPSAVESCAGTTTREIEACAGAENLRESTNLDAVLSQVRARESPSKQAALDESQRQWAAYVATFCSAHTSDGGSLDPVDEASCKAELTHQRAVDVCNWFMPNADLDAVADPPEACRMLGK